MAIIACFERKCIQNGPKNGGQITTKIVTFLTGDPFGSQCPRRESPGDSLVTFPHAFDLPQAPPHRKNKQTAAEGARFPKKHASGQAPCEILWKNVFVFRTHLNTSQNKQTAAEGPCFSNGLMSSHISKWSDLGILVCVVGSIGVAETSKRLQSELVFQKNLFSEFHRKCVPSWVVCYFVGLRNSGNKQTAAEGACFPEKTVFCTLVQNDPSLQPFACFLLSLRHEISKRPKREHTCFWCFLKTPPLLGRSLVLPLAYLQNVQSRVICKKKLKTRVGKTKQKWHP